jgi:7-carboxy-7-deazaguanine synthase
MSYRVKELFYSLQGEGANTGRPAVFCRFSGCNLWSGREQDREEAICKFCDTDFVGTDGPEGNSYSTAEGLAKAVVTMWRGSHHPFVICTGGEPLLQLDGKLLAAFHDAGAEIAVETNGTRLPPAGIDWITVSPKAGASLLLRTGDELKLVYPQEGADPKEFEQLQFRYFFLQPMDGPERQANTVKAVQYCLQNPRWRLSLQTHKILGIP